MKVNYLLIECDMPFCDTGFKAQFVEPIEKVRLEKVAKREGWREVRIGKQMAQVCPGHPEVI